MNKKNLKLKAEFKNYCAIIEEDLLEIGSYLYIYENGEGKFDFLQNTVDLCKEVAFEEFGIPMDIWHEVNE